jgi:hypothetical protein
MPLVMMIGCIMSYFKSAATIRQLIEGILTWEKEKVEITFLLILLIVFPS